MRGDSAFWFEFGPSAEYRADPPSGAGECAGAERIQTLNETAADVHGVFKTIFFSPQAFGDASRAISDT